MFKVVHHKRNVEGWLEGAKKEQGDWRLKREMRIRQTGISEVLFGCYPIS